MKEAADCGSYIGGTPGRGGYFVNEPSYHYSGGRGSLAVRAPEG